MSSRVIPRIRARSPAELDQDYYTRVRRYIARYESTVLRDLVHHQVFPLQDDELVLNLRVNLERLRNALYFLTFPIASPNFNEMRHMVLHLQRAIEIIVHLYQDQEGFDDLEVSYSWPGVQLIESWMEQQ